MYREQLLSELKQPKNLQKLTEDFFIEMERALKTVERVLPNQISDKNVVRDVLIMKYRSGIIKDIVDFRYLPKIAKAKDVGVDLKLARRALSKIFLDNNYSVAEGFEDTVAEAYSERTVLSKVLTVSHSLEELEPEGIDQNLEHALSELKSVIQKLIGRSR